MPKIPTETRFQRRQTLTMPLFSLAHRPHMYVKITGEAYSAEMPGMSRSEDGRVPVIPCIDLESGEEGLLISLTVLQSALERIDGSYVGKCFEIEARPPRTGKDYRDVCVWLIDEPAGG